MFCKKCGKEIEAGSEFCHFCGAITEVNYQKNIATNMKNKLTVLDKAVKVSIIAGALIVALSIAYYLVAFLPQKEKARVEQQKQEQQAKDDEKKKAEDRTVANKKALNFCLSLADDNYWAYVKLNGTEKKDGTVYANNDVWDRADKTKQSEIANCYRKYPQ